MHRFIHFYVIYVSLIVQIRNTLSLIAMLITRGRRESQRHFLECFCFGVKHQPGDCGSSSDVSMLSRVTLIKVYACQSISIYNHIICSSSSGTTTSLSIGLMHLHALQLSGDCQSETPVHLLECHVGSDNSRQGDH